MEKFLQVSKRWYQKAIQGEDSYDQFISIWISFNAIYGTRLESSEFAKIKSTIRELKRENISIILSIPEIQFFCDLTPPIRYLKHDHISDTAQAQERIKMNIHRNPKEALVDLTFILNKVRNNLFHGDKRLENVRDVEIVKHSYPIVKEIVRCHLGLDGRIEEPKNVRSTKNSMEERVFHKIDELHQEIKGILNHRDMIPNDEKHPISILLDRINIQGNAIGPGMISPNQLKEIRRNLLELYEVNKPQVLKDIEEVYYFVESRMKEVIDEGASKEEVKKFYDEYIQLQSKYIGKGYWMKQ